MGMRAVCRRLHTIDFELGLVHVEVEAVGNEGVTMFDSGMGMRKPEAWLTLLLEDNLFFFRLTLPSQLEAVSAVDHDADYGRAERPEVGIRE
jgi:hypothetical protein